MSGIVAISGGNIDVVLADAILDIVDYDQSKKTDYTY